MQEPEILLKNLNNTLRRLRGACVVLSDAGIDTEEIDSDLLKVMRKMLLAEILGDVWVIAIGGSQGAGKTTLVSTMYDIGIDGNQWLAGNEGRGEKMPVLIFEKDNLSSIQGYVRRFEKKEDFFEIYDVQIDVASFQRVLCDPSTEDLLPILHVPKKYLNDKNQAFLLLPGYEKQDRDNRDWQELMKQALIAAAGCIVVTDETRLANQQQLEIAKDMLENEFKDSQPYIVISKTESSRNNHERQKHLKQSAQSVFKISNELYENHIILTGSNERAYVEEWLPTLAKAIDDLNFTGQSNRHLQKSHLSNLLSKDLSRVLNKIRSKAKLYYVSDTNGLGDGAQMLTQILEEFDDAASTLKLEYNEIIEKLLKSAYQKADSYMSKELIANHEGIWNRVKNTLDTHNETKVKLQELVRNSWQLGMQDFLEKYVHDISDVTFSKLGGISNHISKDTYLLNEDTYESLRKTQYLSSTNQIVTFEKLTEEAINDIGALLRGSQNELSKSLPSNIKLLPALTLEYSRLLYAFPQVSVELFSKDEINESIQNFEDGVQSLKDGVELGKTAIRSVAALLAVDVVSDGKSDILAAVFGKAVKEDDSIESDGSIPSSIPIPPPVMLNPWAVGAVAVIATSYLSIVALSRVRGKDKQASIQAQNMLYGIQEHYIAHFSKQFDDAMRVTREQIKSTLSERYKIDENFTKKDRLVRAIVDAKSIVDELRYELDSSGIGLQVLIANRDN